MTFYLSYPLTQLSTERYGIPKGTSGHGSYSLIGICLHQLGMPIERYVSLMQTPCEYEQIRPGEHGSVHYAIGDDGALYRFVAESNTAWGVRTEHNPTWSLLPPGVDPNYVLIHIGLEDFGRVAPLSMFNSLAQLIAYIADNQSLTLDADHIITHDTIDDAYASCAGALLGNVIAAAQIYLAGGQPLVPNPAVIYAQLQTLQTQVDSLQADFDAWQVTVAGLAAHPAVVGSALLGHVRSSSTLLVNGTTGIATIPQLACAYTLGSSVILAPSITTIINFDTILSDPQSWVTTGVFWKTIATVNGLYRLRTRIQFASSDWTAGDTIQLAVYKNGVLYRTIAQRVIEANLTGKVIDVTGECSLLVSSNTDYYDVRATQTNLASRTVSAGEVLMEKVGA